MNSTGHRPQVRHPWDLLRLGYTDTSNQSHFLVSAPEQVSLYNICRASRNVSAHRQTSTIMPYDTNNPTSTWYANQNAWRPYDTNDTTTTWYAQQSRQRQREDREAEERRSQASAITETAQSSSHPPTASGTASNVSSGGNTTTSSQK